MSSKFAVITVTRKPHLPIKLNPSQRGHTDPNEFKDIHQSQKISYSDVMYLLDIKLVTTKTTRNAVYTSGNAKYTHQDAVTSVS